jgi:NAD(P)-dependent dehydrogenase (short-subunit alcohol dehydrogenase family)
LTRSLEELGDLSGRGALVTGAGRLGRVACEALVELGAAVVVADVDGAAAEGVAREVGGEPVAGDVADEEEAGRLVAESLRRAGSLDVLVHTAALVGTSELEGWAEPFERQTVAAWRRALDVNLTSAFVLCQQAAPALERSGHGSVVCFASTYGLVGPDFSLYEGTEMANPAAYGASKGGLIQLVRYLATALAPRVRVNALSPGGVEAGQPASFRERYEARTPLQRMAVPEDVKGAVAFLASDLSRYVTGHNLVVDGGWTAW